LADLAIVIANEIIIIDFVLQIFYYSNSVFVAAGIPENYVQFATLGTGIINTCMTLFSVSVHKFEAVSGHQNLYYCSPDFSRIQLSKPAM
jgi:hypothetical protein